MNAYAHSRGDGNLMVAMISVFDTRQTIGFRAFAAKWPFNVFNRWPLYQIRVLLRQV
jgi:hypothetical protein